jgi:hypothetical protein
MERRQMASAKKARIRKSRKAVSVVEVPDVKAQAANDVPVVTLPSTLEKSDAGKARSVGIQDFILAGRPSKADFIAVYGPMGPQLTWVARAALGVDAAHFQKALKSGKCVAPVAK